MIYYFIVLAGVFACSASQLLLKKSAMMSYRHTWGTILNWRVLLAYSIMFATIITNIFAMRNGVQLKDMPILEATGYIFVPVLSFLVLREKITVRTWGSIALILVGMMIFFL